MPRKNPGQGDSQRAYAAHRGVCESAVRHAKARGLLAFHDDGTIDRAGTDIKWTQAVHPTHGGKRAPRDTSDKAAELAAVIASLPPDLRDLPHLEIRRLLDGAKVVIARTDGEIAALRLATLRGELVPVADLAPAWFRIGRGVRDRVLAVPVRVSPEAVALVLSNAGDAGVAAVALSGMLDRELRAALIDLDTAPATGVTP